MGGVVELLPGCATINGVRFILTAQVPFALAEAKV
jgi:hypothetical protein